MQSILSPLPDRESKPRDEGITMMMDKGLSIREAENFLEINSEYTDIIKLGFGTSLITPNISRKIKLYKENNILVYAGGTLFEAFAMRNQIDDYKKYLYNIGIEMVEISDGVIDMKHNSKCAHIIDFAKDFKVISEVGSKNQNEKTDSIEWSKYMKKELDAGSWKVIAEARESGNVGICKKDGTLEEDIIHDIVNKILLKDIIWEAPKKSQQVWFINKFGSNINLGNISYQDIIPLECLRLGLRGDTLKKL